MYIERLGCDTMREPHQSVRGLPGRKQIISALRREAAVVFKVGQSCGLTTVSRPRAHKAVSFNQDSREVELNDPHRSACCRCCQTRGRLAE